MKRRAGASAIALLLLTACGATGPALRGPLPEDRPAARALLESLVERAGERQALRGRARISIDGPEGSARASQRLVAQRPDRMRVEVLGLFDQVQVAIATDGMDLEVFDAAQGRVETRRVHSAILLETVGIALSPDEAVAVLLGAPLLPEGAEVVAAIRHHDGHLAVALADEKGLVRQRLSFSAGGDLQGVGVYDTQQMLRWRVRYDDYRDVEGDVFPFDIDLEFPGQATAAALSFRWVEFNPELSPDIFRFSAGRGGSLRSPGGPGS